MRLYAIDKEIMRKIENPEKEYNRYESDILYYLKHKGKTSIRFKNYSYMLVFKEEVEKRLDNIKTYTDGPILIIERKKEENE